MSKNHQLGVLYDVDKHDLELFASPINRTMPEFCSAYPSIDKYYIGNKGNFFHYKFESGKRYVANPPYIEHIMNDMSDRIIDQMNDTNNVKINIYMPIWDSSIDNKIISSSSLSKISRKYIAYETLANSKYIISINRYMMSDYQYIDRLSGKKVSVTNVYHIILSN
jgi:hypothetical protein